jgi:hypothetical protein
VLVSDEDRKLYVSIRFGLVLYGLRGKIAYILHGHKGIVTSLSAQKGIYRSILSLIGLGHTSCVAIGLSWHR